MYGTAAGFGIYRLSTLSYLCNYHGSHGYHGYNFAIGHSSLVLRHSRLSLNRTDGISEIEGKAARVAASEEGPSAFQIRVIRGLLLSVNNGISPIKLRHLISVNIGVHSS